MFYYYGQLLHLQTLQYGNILTINLAIHTTWPKPEKTLLLVFKSVLQIDIAKT
jgi:hypothetical protein